MTKREIVVIGTGGHGRETVDIVRACPNLWTLLGVVGDRPKPNDAIRLERLNTSFLGPLDVLAELSAQFIIGIGLPEVRRRIDLRVREYDLEAAVLIHPLASIGSDVRLAEGVVLAAGSHLTTNVQLGRHTHLNVNASVSHECVVGDYVTIAPGAVVCGSVSIGDDAYIGAGAVIRQDISIGAGTLIGAGSVVVRDVPAGVVAMGCPARW